MPDREVPEHEARAAGEHRLVHLRAQLARRRLVLVLVRGLDQEERPDAAVPAREVEAAAVGADAVVGVERIDGEPGQLGDVRGGAAGGPVRGVQVGVAGFADAERDGVEEIHLGRVAGSLGQVIAAFDPEDVRDVSVARAEEAAVPAEPVDAVALHLLEPALVAAADAEVARGEEDEDTAGARLIEEAIDRGEVFFVAAVEVEHVGERGSSAARHPAGRLRRELVLEEVDDDRVEALVRAVVEVGREVGRRQLDDRGPGGIALEEEGPAVGVDERARVLGDLQGESGGSVGRRGHGRATGGRGSQDENADGGESGGHREGLPSYATTRELPRSRGIREARMAPRAGLEPAALRLTAARSTIELPGKADSGATIIGGS